MQSPWKVCIQGDKNSFRFMQDSACQTHSLMHLYSSIPYANNSKLAIMNLDLTLSMYELLIDER